MTKARDLADLGNKTSLDEINDAYDAGALSNRNLIINGAMQVAQRGTSLTGIGNNAGGPFVCDRFQHVQGSTGGSGVMTMEQSTDAADGFGSSLKLTVTTADTLSVGENVGIRYRSEGRDGQSLKFGTSSAEKFTVSFWTKASVAGTYSLQIFGPARSALSSYTINSANTWEYKTITFNGDTSVALPNTSVAGFEVTWHLDAGPDDITSAYDWGNTAAFRAVTGQVNLMANTGNTWQVTGVQLEVGDTATPFEHRSYGDELAKCHRYFQKLSCSGTSTRHMIGAGHYNTSTSLVIAYQHYGGVMRANPTATLSALNLFDLEPFDTEPTAISINVPTNKGCYIGCTDGTSRTTGFAGSLFFDTAGAFISFDAEL